MPNLPVVNVLDVPITAMRFDEQMALLAEWAATRQRRVVCVANVHMLMEAHSNPEFAAVLSRADVVTSDGMPLVWMMRRLGAPLQVRVAGLDIFRALCALAQQNGLSVFFVGSDEKVLERVCERLHRDYPTLKIAGAVSPPFRPLSSAEDEELVSRINTSAAHFIFVAFGCPKQERWMDANKEGVQGVMIGVGAVFEVYAGLKLHAPHWMRESGLEWLFRLIQEPRRLWRRYWSTNVPFVVLALRQLLANQLK